MLLYVHEHVQGVTLEVKQPAAWMHAHAYLRTPMGQLVRYAFPCATLREWSHEARRSLLAAAAAPAVSASTTPTTFRRGAGTTAGTSRRAPPG